MYKVRFTFSLLTILLFGLFFSSVGPAQASYYSNLITQLTSSSGSKGQVNTDGKSVVWTVSPGLNGQTSQVFYTNLGNRQIVPVTDRSGAQYTPKVDGDNVIWIGQGVDTNDSGFKINLKNMVTGKEEVVGEGGPAAISGDWVVWLTGTQGFLARNIRTMEKSIELPASTLGQYFSFEDGRLVYSTHSLGGQTRSWSLKTLKIGDSQPTVLETGNSGYKNLGGFDLHNGLLAYWVGNDLKTINFKTDEHKFVVENYQNNFSYVTTDGRYIFWISQQPNDPTTNGVLPGYQEYDTQTGVLLPFNLLLANDVNRAIQVRSGQVVFKVFNQIYAAPVSSFLPTISQPPTDITPTQNYFYETGHTLANGFKNFWDRNGGLAVFGYSRTEEFGELNRDTGQVYTVQYFERQRYEYHPENRGTPYEVLLGRLGVTDAQRRNLLNTAAFKPVAATNDPSCTYFSETKHQACGSFLSYWRSHGLDLGEPGFSFRESLALFGFPISEAFQNPQTGRLVQYFERARFEYYPENKDTPYEVLLGLLGNQELQTRGWLAGT